MAAPVRKEQELELRVDSLAYGGNGVARLNGFVVFVNRGASRRRRAGPDHQGQAEPCRGGRARGRRGGRTPRGGAVRALPRVRAAASRISPTRPSSTRRRSRSPTRSADRRLLRPRARAGRGRGDPSSTTGTSWSTPSRRSRRHGRARLPPSRPLGRGAGRRALLAHDRPRQRHPRGGEGLGARAGPPRLRPGAAGGLPPPPRRPRGAQHRAGARRPGHGAGRPGGRRRRSSRPSGRSPRCDPSTGR